MPNVSEFRDPNTGEFQSWDVEHARLVLREKRKHLTIYPNREIVGHPAVGTSVRRGDEVLHIESVHKHWSAGFYEYAVYRSGDTKSHGTAFIANINSIDPIIIELTAGWQAETTVI